MKLSLDVTDVSAFLRPLKLIELTLICPLLSRNEPIFGEKHESSASQLLIESSADVSNPFSSIAVDKKFPDICDVVADHEVE